MAGRWLRVKLDVLDAAHGLAFAQVARPDFAQIATSEHA
jgi:hypothetical protein